MANIIDYEKNTVDMISVSVKITNIENEFCACVNVKKGARLSDWLNSYNKQFIILTNVKNDDITAEILMVNKDHIIYIYPDDKCKIIA